MGNSVARPGEVGYVGICREVKAIAWMPVDTKIEARLVLRLASLAEGVGIHGVIPEGIEAVDTH